MNTVHTSSQIFSSFGIQLVARWQFCNTTQVPSLMAVSIILVAMGPYVQHLINYILNTVQM